MALWADWTGKRPGGGGGRGERDAWEGGEGVGNGMNWMPKTHVTKLLGSGKVTKTLRRFGVRRQNAAASADADRGICSLDQVGLAVHITLRHESRPEEILGVPGLN